MRVSDGLDSASCTYQRRSMIRRRECQACGGRLDLEEIEYYQRRGLRADHPARMCLECANLEIEDLNSGVTGLDLEIEDFNSSGSYTDQDLVRFSGELCGLGAKQYEWV